MDLFIPWAGNELDELCIDFAISFDSRMANAITLLNVASSGDSCIEISSLWAALNCRSKCYFIINKFRYRIINTNIIYFLFLLLIGLPFNTGSGTFSLRLSLDELA